MHCDSQPSFDSKPTVFVIDDDAPTRESLVWLLESANYRAECHASGEEFLARFAPERPGCLILDLRLPGISGVALQEALAARGVPLPVIILTGYGDVPTAVRAFHQGAFDFIQKPFKDDLLLACIDRALTADRDRRKIEHEKRTAATRLERLTRREREVMTMVVSGKANKVVAYDLGISPKTVETHRARLMEKLGVASFADLVRLDFIALHGGAVAGL